MQCYCGGQEKWSGNLIENLGFPKIVRSAIFTACIVRRRG